MSKLALNDAPSRLQAHGELQKHQPRASQVVKSSFC